MVSSLETPSESFHFVETSETVQKTLEENFISRYVSRQSRSRVSPVSRRSRSGFSRRSNSRVSRRSKSRVSRVSRRSRSCVSRRSNSRVSRRSKSRVSRRSRSRVSRRSKSRVSRRSRSRVSRRSKSRFSRRSRSGFSRRSKSRVSRDYHKSRSHRSNSHRSTHSSSRRYRSRSLHRSALTKSEFKRLEDRQKKIEKNLESLKVVVGKTFFLLKELAKNQEASTSLNSTNSIEVLSPVNFEMVQLPMESIGDLLMLERDIAKQDVFNYVQDKLMTSCIPTPTSSTTATLTGLVNEIMTVELRAKTSLKERKNQDTNMLVMSKELPNFLKMLKLSFQNALNISGKIIQKKEMQDVFTIVWSRNKQDLKRARQSTKPASSAE